MKRPFAAVCVIIIVSGLLSFAPNKGGVVCASLNQNDGCQLLFGKTEINNGKPHATYYKYNAWVGDSCKKNRCETLIELYDEQ